MIDRYIEIDDIKTCYYKINKTNSSEWVVFLHGWGLCSKAFRTTINAIGENFNIIAFDLPGFGRSKSPKGFWGYEAYAKHLFLLLNKLNINNIHLVGQSMGGGISLAFAALYPKRVKSLTVTNSSGLPIEDMPRKFFKRIYELYAQFLTSKITMQNYHMITSFSYNLFFRPFSVHKAIYIPTTHDIFPLLHKIQAPTLMAWGRNDCITPISFAIKMSSEIPNCKLTLVDGAFHEWSLVRSKEFTKMTIKFINEQI